MCISIECIECSATTGKKSVWGLFGFLDLDLVLGVEFLIFLPIAQSSVQQQGGTLHLKLRLRLLGQPAQRIASGAGGDFLVPSTPPQTQTA